MTSASVALTVIPAQAVVPEAVKAGCCAKMKLDAPANDCGHHAPKSTQEKECCAACVVGLALFLTPSTSFVYPSSGQESFAAFFLHEQLRSHRPPVPPPRA
jgi:hypothetical protein